MKNTLSRLKIFIFFFCIWLIASGCVTSDKIITKGPVDPKVVRDVQKTVDLFNQIMKEELDIKLLKPVPVYVTADTELYRRVLSNEFKISKDEVPKWSESTGFSTNGGVAMDASKSLMDNAKERCFVTAHELFHQLENSIMGGSRSENPRYIQEGAAELIGARVAEKFGFTSIRAWSCETLNEVRSLSHPATVPELLAADESDAWHKLIDEKKHPYGVSSLLIISLFDLSQKDVYKGLSDYFIQIGCGKNIDTAFTKAFGLSYKNFLEEFDKWYKTAVSKPAEIEIVADKNVPETVILETKKTFEVTQVFFKENWGDPLHISPRIILASDRVIAASSLEKEFGIESSEANKIFGEPSSTQAYYKGSTAVINLQNPTVQESPTLAVASVFSRMYQQEISSQTQAEGMFWLFMGGSDLAAALITDQGGKKSLAEQKKSWLESIRKASPCPQLFRLQTKKEWEEAYRTFGSQNLYAFSRMAALYLTEKYGQKSLATWYRQIKEPQDAEKSFEKIFGISWRRFDQDFDNYLKEQLKPAV